VKQGWVISSMPAICVVHGGQVNGFILEASIMPDPPLQFPFAVVTAVHYSLFTHH
jgi:hypothetical protein